ncbi:hypothetical protein FACS1894177_07460 [Bacteroidia bacterium]|nr:hypothetical protein FACS1894177_07460 [Bacteroidia bacterium]
MKTQTIMAIITLLFSCGTLSALFDINAPVNRDSLENSGELSGREVLRKTCPAENGYRQETLPVSSYPPGTYILRISCGNQYAAEQIVKK